MANKHIHDPSRQPTQQGAMRAARRKQYYNMTPAEILRSMSDVELDRNARKGAPLAVMEQAYRHSLREAWNDNNTQRSDFERTVMVEGGL